MSPSAPGDVDRAVVDDPAARVAGGRRRQQRAARSPELQRYHEKGIGDGGQQPARAGPSLLVSAARPCACRRAAAAPTPRDKEQHPASGIPARNVGAKCRSERTPVSPSAPGDVDRAVVDDPAARVAGGRRRQQRAARSPELQRYHEKGIGDGGQQPARAGPSLLVSAARPCACRRAAAAPTPRDKEQHPASGIPARNVGAKCRSERTPVSPSAPGDVDRAVVDDPAARVAGGRRRQQRAARSPELQRYHEKGIGDGGQQPARAGPSLLVSAARPCACRRAAAAPTPRDKEQHPASGIPAPKCRREMSERENACEPFRARRCRPGRCR